VNPFPFYKPKIFNTKFYGKIYLRRESIDFDCAIFRGESWVLDWEPIQEYRVT